MIIIPSRAGRSVGEKGASVPWVAFLAGALLLVGLGYHQVLTFWFTDRDTLMNLAEVRLGGNHGLLQLLAKPLTGGRAGEDANFYRPVVMLTFASLRWFFGGWVVAYHAFDLLLHAAVAALTATLAFLCARRVGVPEARLFGATAGVTMALHPSGDEVVPAVARVGDLLVTTFSLAALISLLSVLDARDRAGSWRVWVASRTGLYVLLFTLALGSKEPGILLLGMMPIHILLLDNRIPLNRRVIEAVLLCLPCAAVALAYLVVRARVLGEVLGGYHLDYSLIFMLRWVVQLMWLDLSFPGFGVVVERFLPPFHLAAGWRGAVPIVGFGLAVAWLVLNRQRLARALRSPLIYAILPALCAILLYAALFVITRTYDRRLLYPAVPFACFLPAALGVWTVREISHLRKTGRDHRPSPARLAVLGAGVLATLLFLVQSPLLHRYEEWRWSGQATWLLTEHLRQDWTRLPDKASVVILNLADAFSTDPFRRVTYSGRSSTNGPLSHSIQAWLNETFPGKEIDVTSPALYLYCVPLDGFRHHAEIRDGRLLFNTPPESPEVISPITHALAFERIARDRVAVHYRGSPASKDAYVLVFDGESPAFFPVSSLTPPPERSATRYLINRPARSILPTAGTASCDRVRF